MRRLALPWRSHLKGPAPPAPVERESFEQTSMALEHVIARLEDAPRPGVLDLGQPVAPNLALYASHGARIAFADLYRFLAATPSRVTSAAGFTELLPEITTHIDIVLAWDLLNYLSLAEIEWLGESVREKCAPSAILFALVSCPGPMPATPSYHTISRRDTLRVDTHSVESRPSPSYSEQSLLRALPHVSVKNRFQLRSSMVEYLFAWE